MVGLSPFKCLSLPLSLPFEKAGPEEFSLQADSLEWEEQPNNAGKREGRHKWPAQLFSASFPPLNGNMKL